MYTRNKTGLEDVSCYCNDHRPSKLRKNLEIKEKILYEDFVNFIKNYEKLDKDGFKRTLVTDFSYKEKFRLYKNIDEFLNKKIGEFDINIKWNKVDKGLRGFVEDIKEYYTILDPNTISVEDIHTKTHEKAECQEFYAKNMMSIMKKELKILKLPIFYYKP